MQSYHDGRRRPQPEPDTTDGTQEPAPPNEPLVTVAPDRDTTDAGLNLGTASVACGNAGKAAFPSGWDAHWTLGFIGEEISADSYFPKASVDVTN